MGCLTGRAEALLDCRASLRGSVVFAFAALTAFPSLTAFAVLAAFTTFPGFPRLAALSGPVVSRQGSAARTGELRPAFAALASFAPLKAFGAAAAAETAGHQTSRGQEESEAGAGHG